MPPPFWPPEGTPPFLWLLSEGGHPGPQLSEKGWDIVSGVLHIHNVQC